MAKRTRGRRTSASPIKAFTRSIPRDKVPGGPRRGGRQSSIASRGEFAAFLSRLRRLEVCILMISGRMQGTGSLEILLDKIYELKEDTKDIPDGDKGRDTKV